MDKGQMKSTRLYNKIDVRERHSLNIYGIYSQRAITKNLVKLYNVCYFLCIFLNYINFNYCFKFNYMDVQLYCKG
jgi:hypothetical protein